MKIQPGMQVIQLTTRPVTIDTTQATRSDRARTQEPEEGNANVSTTA